MLTIICLGFVIYGLVSTRLHDNYIKRYQTLSSILADTLSELDSTTDHVMRNALTAIRSELDSKKSIPSNAQLATLRDQLEITSIDYVLPSGMITRSSDFKNDSDSVSYNLFQFCPAYRDLFTGKTRMDQTPLVPSAITGKITKYALVPGSNLSYVANVGYETKFIGQALQGTLKSDQNVASIELLSPSGTSLGYFAQDSSTHPKPKEHPQNNSQSSAKQTTTITNNLLMIESSVQSPVSQCCECIVKKLTLPSNGIFFYRLQTVVTLSELNKTLRNFKLAILLVSGLTLLGCFLLAQALSSKLVARIQRIDFMARQIASNGDTDLRLNERKGNDEIAKFAQQFDAMLDKIRDQKLEIQSNANSAAIARTTQMLAHDVRKPFSLVKSALSILSHAQNIDDVRKSMNVIGPSIDKSLTSVNAMLDDIMEIGRIEKPITEPTSLIAIIEASLSETFQVHQNTQIALRYNFASSPESVGEFRSG